MLCALEPDDSAMGINYEDIKEDVAELWSFFQNDLSILIRSPVGGNYAAVFLATTACEVLGPLRFISNGDREFFRNYMVPASWREVASSLYDALRNGLAHSYATKTILNVNGGDLELGISWSKMPHLSFNEQKSVLYINARDFAEKVTAALVEYQSELQAQPDLCALYAERRLKKRIINVHTPVEHEAWKALLSGNARGA